MVFTDPITGPVRPVPVEIVGRAGCDRDPVDAATPEGRLLLTSFVWPFDVHRHERLAAALRVAARHPVHVDRASASDWLAPALGRTGGGVLPVVWHSITRLYWPPEDAERVEATISAYGQHRPVARVAMEFGVGPDAPTRPEVSTTLWRPRAPVRHRRLGTAHDHGPPVRLDP